MVPIGIALALVSIGLGAPSEIPSGPTSEAAANTSLVSVAASMPRGVTSFGAVVDRGWLYTLGGFFGTPHAYDFEGQSGAFRRMNLADGTWQDLASAGRIQSVALVAHGDYLYRVGGMVVGNAPGEKQELLSIDTFERFDPLTDKWSELPPLPRPRSSHMAAVIGDHLYVAGGWQRGGAVELGPDDAKWHDTLLVYDLTVEPARGEWTEIPAPFRRRALGVAQAGGRLYMLGGMDPDAEISEEVNVFDPTNGSWSLAPSFPESGFGMAGVGTDDGVFASGSSGSVFRLRPGSEQWELVSTLAFPRFFHQWVKCGDDELLAVGGILKTSRISHIEALNTKAASGVAAKRWSVPFPADGCQGMQVVMSGGLVYLYPEHKDEGPAGGAIPASYTTQGYALDLDSMTWSTLANAAVTAKGDGEEASVERFAKELRESSLMDGAFELELVGAQLPGPRSGFASAGVGHSLYLIGGIDPDGEFVHRGDVYDSEAGTWSEIPEPGTHRVNPKLVALGDRLFLAGGEISDSEGVSCERNPLEVFDSSTAAWSVLIEELPFPADQFHMFPFHDRLLLISTQLDADHVELILLNVGQILSNPHPSVFHG